MKYLVGFVVGVKEKGRKREEEAKEEDDQEVEVLWVEMADPIGGSGDF